MPKPLFRGPLDEDLRPLSALLWQRGVAHRIVEDAGDQVVLLGVNADSALASELLRRWTSGELRIELRKAAPRPKQAKLRLSLRSSPVTMLLILLSVLGFLLVYLQAPLSWMALLTFEPFTLIAGRPVFTESHEPWRFITPVFLHFGWMHIVFNCLWCWELGRKIESRLGSLNVLGLFLVIAAVSNYAQHAVSGPVLFGGLSGVVYGFLGFAWSAGRLNPRWAAMAPANSIMFFMVGWLLICLAGVIDVLGFSVANAAHVGGLVSGVFIGAVFGFVYRVRP